MSNENEDSLRRVIKTKEQADLFMRELNHLTNDAQPERLLTISDLLEGRDMMVESDMGVLRLTIKKVEMNSRYIQLTPDTRENDWWGAGYSEEFIVVHFTNGHKKEYKSFKEIEVFSKKSV